MKAAILYLHILVICAVSQNLNADSVRGSRGAGKPETSAEDVSQVQEIKTRQLRSLLTTSRLYSGGGHEPNNRWASRLNFQGGHEPNNRLASRLYLGGGHEPNNRLASRLNLGGGHEPNNRLASRLYLGGGHEPNNRWASSTNYNAGKRFSLSPGNGYASPYLDYPISTVPPSYN